MKKFIIAIALVLTTGIISVATSTSPADKNVIAQAD